MKRRKSMVVLLSLLTFGSLTSGLLASIAWFTANNSFDVAVSGSVVEEYFHGDGDGSENNPFIITRPIHYYHLVEFFQRKTTLSSNAHFGTDYLYFQVGYDLNNDGELEVYNYDDQGTYQGTVDSPSYSKTLNMAYYSGGNALLPIGTNEVPFIGSFDGNASEGIIISNLNICCSETVEINGTPTARAASDVGIFGYVADQDGSSNPTVICNANFDGVTIDLSDAATSVAGSSTTIPHEDAHSTVNVGYLAGHVHTYTNHNSTGPTNASPFYNIYLNNMTIQGGENAHCDYGYFGLVDTKDGEAPVSVTDVISGQGIENDWGGSFNSKDYTALGYSVRPSSSGIYTKQETGSGGYVMTFSASTNANPNNNNVIYRLRDGSYVPLKFNSEGKAAGSNTGYLVGSNVGSGVNASPKIASYRLNNIGNALTNTAYTNMATTYTNTNNISYNDSKLEVLTYSGGWKRIKDSHNENNNSTNTQIRNYTRTTVEDLGLQRYTDARASLGNILSGSSYVHGIHFDNNQVSNSNKFTIPANTARVDGISYTTTYEVPKGSINFKLQKQGYITFFAGTYNSSNVSLNFFSLNHVFRSGGTITNIKPITEIFLNTAADGDPYVYKYSDNTYSSGTRGSSIFNLTTILSGNAPVVNMLYYFELPVNPGEYAMGVSGSTQGAYMMYLDLGANAGKTNIDVNEFPIFTQINFQYDPSLINSCFNVSFVIPDDSTKETFSIKIYSHVITYQSKQYTCYEIEIINKTNNELVINALLTDDDDNDTNDYLYMYAITYNDGTRVPYLASNTFTGDGGGDTMTPDYEI